MKHALLWTAVVVSWTGLIAILVAMGRYKPHEWKLQSWRDQEITLSHEGHTYTATCLHSYFMDRDPGPVDNSWDFPVCSMPIDYVGRSFPPPDEHQRDREGWFLDMKRSGALLELRRYRDNPDTGKLYLEQYRIGGVR